MKNVKKFWFDVKSNGKEYALKNCSPNHKSCLAAYMICIGLQISKVRFMTSCVWLWKMVLKSITSLFIIQIKKRATLLCLLSCSLPYHRTKILSNLKPTAVISERMSVSKDQQCYDRKKRSSHTNPSLAFFVAHSSKTWTVVSWMSPSNRHYIPEGTTALHDSLPSSDNLSFTGPLNEVR